MTLSVNRENGELAGLREANDLNRDGSVRLPGAGRFETEKTSKPQVLPNVGDTGGRKKQDLVNANRQCEITDLRIWLPSLDSNQDSRRQRPLSYH